MSTHSFSILTGNSEWPPGAMDVIFPRPHLEALVRLISPFSMISQYLSFAWAGFRRQSVPVRLGNSGRRGEFRRRWRQCSFPYPESRLSLPLDREAILRRSTTTVRLFPKKGRLLKTLGCNVGLRGVKAVAPQTVSDSPRRTPMICLPVGWTPPYNPLTGRRRPRVGKRASRLNLMVVRWGSEHCDGAELVSAYVELSSCVAVSRLEKARVGYVRAQIH